MSHRYSTAFSHVILAGTSIYCLVAIKGQNLNFPHATYGIIAVNSLLGIWRWGNPDHGSSAERPYNFTTLLQTLFALPCITTSVWLGYNYQWELAYAHSVASLIPLVTYLLDSRASEDLVQLIVFVNTLSLGIVSFLHENYYGIAAAVSFALDHFCIKDGGSSDLPALDLYNYGLCFFAFFALRALGD